MVESGKLKGRIIIFFLGRVGLGNRRKERRKKNILFIGRKSAFFWRKEWVWWEEWRVGEGRKLEGKVKKIWGKRRVERWEEMIILN